MDIFDQIEQEQGVAVAKPRVDIFDEIETETAAQQPPVQQPEPASPQRPKLMFGGVELDPAAVHDAIAKQSKQAQAPRDVIGDLIGQFKAKPDMRPEDVGNIWWNLPNEYRDAIVQRMRGQGHSLAPTVIPQVAWDTPEGTVIPAEVEPTALDRLGDLAGQWELMRQQGYKEGPKNAEPTILLTPEQEAQQKRTKELADESWFTKGAKTFGNSLVSNVERLRDSIFMNQVTAAELKNRVLARRNKPEQEKSFLDMLPESVQSMAEGAKMLVKGELTPEHERAFGDVVPNGIGDKAAIAVGGTAAFLVELLTVKAGLPSFLLKSKVLSNTIAFELLNEDWLGKGAIQGAVFGALEKIPAKTIAQQALKLGSESAALGGMTAIEGGEPEDIIMSALIPVAMFGVGKAKNRLDVLRTGRDMVVSDTPARRYVDEAMRRMGFEPGVRPSKRDVARAYKELASQAPKDMRSRFDLSPDGVSAAADNFLRNYDFVHGKPIPYAKGGSLPAPDAVMTPPPAQQSPEKDKALAVKTGETAPVVKESLTPEPVAKPPAPVPAPVTPAPQEIAAPKPPEAPTAALEPKATTETVAEPERATEAAIEPEPIAKLDTPPVAKGATPAVIGEIDKALSEGRTDAGTAALAKRLASEVPDIDSNTSIEFADQVRLATDEIVKAEGLPTHDETGKRIEYQVAGETQSNLATAASETAIKLYRGHDADTLVEEWYHRAWDRLSPQEQQLFDKYHARTGDARPVNEHFAQEGRDFFFSNKLHEPAGGIRNLFAKSRKSLRALIQRIRTLRGAKIPKKIQDLYNRALNPKAQKRGKAVAGEPAQQLRPIDKAKAAQRAAEAKRKAELDKVKTGMKVRDEVLSIERARLAKVVEKLGGQVREAELDGLEAAIKARAQGFMAGISAHQATMKKLIDQAQVLPPDERRKVMRAMGSVKTDKDVQKFVEKVQEVARQYDLETARKALDDIVKEAKKLPVSELSMTINQLLLSVPSARSSKDIDTITNAAMEIAYTVNEAKEAGAIRVGERLQKIADMKSEMGEFLAQNWNPKPAKREEEPSIGKMSRIKAHITPFPTLIDSLGPTAYTAFVEGGRKAENDDNREREAYVDEVREATLDAIRKHIKPARRALYKRLLERVIVGKVTPDEAVAAKKLSPFLKGTRKGVNTVPFETQAGDTIHLTPMERVHLAGHLYDIDTRYNAEQRGAEGFVLEINETMPFRWSKKDSEAFIDSLTPFEMAMFKFTSKQYNGRLADDLDAGTIQSFGHRGARRSGCYQPRRTSGVDRETDIASMLGFHRKSVENMDILKPRVEPHLRPIVIRDALEAYIEQVNKVLTIKHKARWSRDLKVLVGSPEFKELALKFTGPVEPGSTMSVLGQYLLDLDQAFIGGLRPASKAGLLTRGGMWVTDRVATGLVALSHLKNYLSLANILLVQDRDGSTISLKHVVKGVLRYMKKAKRIMKNHAFFRERQGDMRYQTGMLGQSTILGNDGYVHSLSKREFIGILSAEERISAIHVAIALAEADGKGLTGKAAERYALDKAERWVRMDNNPSSVLDSTPTMLEARQSLWTRMMAMFTSQIAQNIDQILRAIKAKRYAAVGGYLVLSGISWAAITNFRRWMWRGGEESDREKARKDMTEEDATLDRIKEWVLDAVEGMGNTVGLDGAVAVFRRLTGETKGGGYGSAGEAFAGPPGQVVGDTLDAAENITSAIGKYMESGTDAERNKALGTITSNMLKVGLGASTVAGVPASAPFRYVRGLWRFVAGQGDEAQAQKAIREGLTQVARGETDLTTLAFHIEREHSVRSKVLYAEARKVSAKWKDAALKHARSGDIERAAQYAAGYRNLGGDVGDWYYRLEAKQEEKAESAKTISNIGKALDIAWPQWRSDESAIKGQLRTHVRDLVGGNATRDDIKLRVEQIADKHDLNYIDVLKRFDGMVSAHVAQLTGKASKAAIDGDSKALAEILAQRDNVISSRAAIIDSLIRQRKSGKITQAQYERAKGMILEAK